MLKRVETMAAEEKISKALKNAVVHVANSVSAWNKKDESAFADSLWCSAEELEYALFLFSMTFRNESETEKWKISPDLRKIEPSSILAEAQKLLKNAEKQMENGKQQDSYKSAYIARHYLLKAQEDLAKKKREAFKKKQ